MTVNDFIFEAIQEDVGSGDHSSLLSVPDNAKGSAQLLVKENGVLAGVDIALKVFSLIDKDLQVNVFIHDGAKVKKGDIAFEVFGKIRSILQAERLVLNIMQRMSGISTKTAYYCSLIEGTHAKLLDTRKTTPNMRYFEKLAVKIGGGCNHRFGLYDMIMLKDNHVDFAGGIENAIKKANNYLKENNLNIKIEIETRNLQELAEVLRVGGIDRIMFDNYSVEDVKKGVQMVAGKYETEASGNITETTIVEYAKTGVDFISVGALTHSVKSLDLSLKAKIK